MRNIRNLTVLLTLLTCSITFSQNNSKGWDKKSNYNRLYNVKTATEIKGVVTAIEEVVPMKGMSSGIHMMVKTGSETISVHLGPEWYLDKQAIQFKVNDNVEVKGSRITIDGKQVIIAREIDVDGKVLKLRDENGIPVWAGKGRG